MAQFKIDGISLRYVNVKDNDRYVTLLTPDRGLVECYARRARRPKSPLMARTEPFVTGTWIGYHRGDHYYLDQVDVRYHYPALNQSVTALTAATQLADLVRDAAGDPGLGEALYELLHYALYALETKPDEYRRIVAASGLYILHILGLAPDPQVCGVCGDPIDKKEKLRINHAACYFVCSKHPYAADRLTGQAVYEPVPASVAETVRFLQKSEPRSYLSFQLGRQDTEALWNVSQVQLMMRLERDWPNLRLMDELEAGAAEMDDLLKQLKQARAQRITPAADSEDVPSAP